GGARGPRVPRARRGGGGGSREAAPALPRLFGVSLRRQGESRSRGLVRSRGQGPRSARTAPEARGRPPDGGVRARRPGEGDTRPRDRGRREGGRGDHARAHRADGEEGHARDLRRDAPPREGAHDSTAARGSRSSRGGLAGSGELSAMRSQPLRVALVHDWLTGMRGGEKCLEVLCEIFPRADLYTLLHVPGSVSPRLEARRIVTSFVQQLPGARRHYRRWLPLFP